ncbi:hypothetical protein [Glycomyces arizonensis]|uniref:hypothetical protein n=1 Tax=Glycomyces arizonensis TaxID=256035 RepID=UPI000419F0A1|nr:hypothetical protein [Glycomyces arizonensis]
MRLEIQRSTNHPTVWAMSSVFVDQLSSEPVPRRGASPPVRVLSRDLACWIACGSSTLALSLTGR